MSLILASGRRRNRQQFAGVPVLSGVERQTVPDITLGAPGTWDATDINNPNVIWDAANARWVMYYTGYYNVPNDGNQDAGLAYAPSLDGPWTKDPLNPVFVDASAGQWSQNGGMEKVGATWVLAYNAAGGSAVWFATSTDLHEWTKLAATFDGGDPFLRVNQNSGALECYYWRSSPRHIYRRSSTDAGATWGAEVHVLDPAPVAYNMQNGGEPSVFVPPGREGEVMLVVVDYFPDGSLSAGRGSILAATEDGGTTWTWHENWWRKSGAASGWDSKSVFDTFMAWEAGRFYLYYAGTGVTDSGTLNMGIQIGHVSVPWPPA